MIMLNFWKPGTVGPGSSLDRATEAEDGLVVSSSLSSLSIQAQRERLPIFKHSTYRRQCETRPLTLVPVDQEKSYYIASRNTVWSLQ
jgi:ATP-dependent RNA helicase DDX35